MPKTEKTKPDFFEELKRRVVNVGGSPGVYLFFDEHHNILYVGKAKHLSKRLLSYFQKTLASPKVARMVEQIRDFQVIQTPSENDALLLEFNLIQEHRPRYNVLLRDDKSFPYVCLEDDPNAVRLSYHRGKAGLPKGKVFGPFLSSAAAKEILQWLERLFQLRTCENSVFRHRSRPCLLHALERCSAPCVGKISSQDYAQQVQQAAMFLSGKTKVLKEQWVARMDAAAKALDYEKAARIRDDLRKLQMLDRKPLNRGEGNVDLIHLQRSYGLIGISQVMVRNGKIIGQEFFYPKAYLEPDDAEILMAFIAQRYLAPNTWTALPEEIVCELSKEAQVRLEYLFKHHRCAVTIASKPKRNYQHWDELARDNLDKTMQAVVEKKFKFSSSLQRLKNVLGRSNPITRLECFDISHHQGEGTVASRVVFGPEGPCKKEYRAFVIEGVAAGMILAPCKKPCASVFSVLKALLRSRPMFFWSMGNFAVGGRTKNFMRAWDLRYQPSGHEERPGTKSKRRYFVGERSPSGPSCSRSSAAFAAVSSRRSAPLCGSCTAS